MAVLKTVAQLGAEIEQLKKDLAVAPEADKAVIKEEITRLEKEQANEDSIDQLAQMGALTPATPAETAVVAELTPEQQAQAASIVGGSVRAPRPSAKKLVIDGEKIKKVVDGEEMEGKPLQRFIHKFKNQETGEWEVEDYGNELKGVVVGVRYAIREKWEEGKTDRYWSDEFTKGNDIKVFQKTNGAIDVIFKGSQNACIDNFATGEITKYNKKVTTYKTELLVYIKLDSGELVKLSSNSNVQDHPYRNYSFSFTKEDPMLKYKTSVTLEWIDDSEIKYWKAVYKRDEPSNFSENFNYGIELKKAFDLLDEDNETKQTVSAPVESEQPPVESKSTPMIDEPVKDHSQPDPEDDIKIEEIPF